ncbi:MAG: hypothetical protein ABW321_13650 [Polyangiales bacterium]
MNIRRSINRAALVLSAAAACGGTEGGDPAAPVTPPAPAASATPAAPAPDAAPVVAPSAPAAAAPSDTSVANSAAAGSGSAPTPGAAISPEPTPPASSKPAEVSSGEVTYTEHVRPILARACVACHSEGQIAPFSLDSYERAQTFAPLIAAATKSRVMPPSVVDNSGACHTFRDLPWLSDEEIATIETWSKEGAPEGNPDLPTPPTYAVPKLEGDVRSIKTPSYVPSTVKHDDYRCFMIDSPFSEETFVTGFDTHPGDQRTAHHMVVFYPMDDISAGLAQLSDDGEAGPGYTCFGAPGVPATVIAAWAPGGGATRYPDGLGIAVVPNRPLIVQMHYNTLGTEMPAADSTQIDLEVKKDGITPGAFANLIDLEMSLPPGKTDAEEIVRGTLASKLASGTGPVQIYGVFPHMHELGRTIKVSVKRASDGDSCLVDAPRYDFHWQRMYFFDEPITVDANDELSVHCVYDTTTRTAVTQWGEGTQDEMCVAGLFIKL